MNLREVKDVENAFTKEVRAKLSEFHTNLSKNCIVYSEPEIAIWKSDPGTYTSEISVEFIKDGSFYDIIEFHIFRDGKLCMSLEEMGSWYTEILQQIVDGKTPIEEVT